MSIQENDTVIEAHDAISRAMGGMNTLHLGPLDYNIATTINDLREAIRLLGSIVPKQIVTERVWKPVESAPFRQVVWVRNEAMDVPVKATRGWVMPDGAVHENTTLFRTVYSKGGCPAGKLALPSEWTEATEEERAVDFDVETAHDLKKRVV